MVVNTPTYSTREDILIDHALRPARFDEYVGQEHVKRNLAILLRAAKKRKEPLEHILIHGPSGLGKTTLAHIIAKEAGAAIKITSGAALEKAGDLGSILTNLQNHDIFFIDEVHRMNKLVEETLYPAMENFQLDIVIGKGPSAKSLQIDLPRFTIIAATTRTSLLSAPFRSRFGVHYRLDFYTPSDIKKIIQRSAKLLDIAIEDPAADILARAARFTPRIANRLLKRTRDLAQSEDKERITADLAKKSLRLLEIDQEGLEDTDRKILRVILTHYRNRPVGIKTIAATIGEEEQTLEEVYEPYLIRIGFLNKTPRGRVVTDLGKKHLGIKALQFT